MSFCRHSTRSAEQRWPELLNAEAITSATTCSGSALESTIIAFRPPVSAMKGTMGPSRAASTRLITRAVAVEPVNATPAMRVSATSLAPTSSPRPGTNASASAGTPASIISSTARAATSGVCSAGFAITALPAAYAAATCPTKIASGKFHGLTHTNGPRPARVEVVGLARRAAQRLGLGEMAAREQRVVAAEVGRLAHLAQRVAERLAGLAREQRDQLDAVRLEEVRGALELPRTLLRGRHARGERHAHGLVHQRGIALLHVADGASRRGIAQRDTRARARHATDAHGRLAVGAHELLLQLRQEGRGHGLVREDETRGVATVPVEVGGQRDLRIGGPRRSPPRP
jgi:hypothetical protein